MTIKSINQHTEINGNHAIRYVMADGSITFKQYPSHVGQGMSKKEQCARKMFFHNTAMMDHRPSALNAAEIARLQKQMADL